MKRGEFLRTMVLGSVGSWGLARAAQAQTEDPALTPSQGEYELNAHFVRSGPGFGNRVAVTFDDGPTPGVTEVVLAELAKRNLHATFFMIGKKAAAYASLAKEVADAGHEIANHTYTHPALSKLSPDKVEYELQKAQDVITAATGKVPVWFRPPYGAFRTNQGPIPRAKSLGVAYWSVDPQDWARPGASVIVDRILTTAKPGSIILMHDLHSQTAEAVGRVLDGLMEKTYAFAPMCGFLGSPYGEFYADSTQTA